MNKIANIQDKNILLLQGPVGPFFKKLDTHFRSQGAKTFRIGFNAGDEFFSNRDNYTPFQGQPEDWAKFVEKFLHDKKINSIFLFGDCRFYQSIATSVAYEMGIEVFVFEEGYIRPKYITLERYGVNNYSRVSRDAKFYKNIEFTEEKPTEDAAPNSVYNWFIVITYYFIAKLFHTRYPNYTHHRNYSATQEFFYGCRSLARKILYKQQASVCLKKIKTSLSKKYFFVPLQTHNDFQILQHSDYGSIEKFIIEVLESFAQHSPQDTLLMFKHHPIDRGRKNFKKFILHQAEELGIEDRILITHDTHLPTCLKNAIGTITINSTVGLSSIYHNTPIISLGHAIYDIEGLTCKGTSLNDFWTKHKEPDSDLYAKYRAYLIQNTQINANFYGQFQLIKNI